MIKRRNTLAAIALFEGTGFGKRMGMLLYWCKNPVRQFSLSSNCIEIRLILEISGRQRTMHTRRWRTAPVPVGGGQGAGRPAPRIL